MKTFVHAAWLTRHSQYLTALLATTSGGIALAATFGWTWTLWAPAATTLIFAALRTRQLGARGAARAAHDEYSIRYRWDSACTDAKLDQRVIWPHTIWLGTDTGKGVKACPRIRHIEHHPNRVTVVAERMRQPDEAWRLCLTLIAGELGYPVPTFQSRGPRTVALVFPRAHKPLTAYTSSPSTKPHPLDALPVAKTTTGTTARLRLLGSHILIVGATGSGKGSVLWTITARLTPDTTTGRTQLWGIDAKGGVELGMARHVFTRFVDPGPQWPQRVAATIADARRTMEQRQAAMIGNTRLHRPTPHHPLIVLVIDEFLALVTDPTLKPAMTDLMIILSQGRACGVTVIATTQLSQKDVLGPIRDLFPTVVGLRMTSPEQARMALGADTYKNGAKADLIDDKAPGTGYLIEDGKTPVLCRFPWWDDAALRRLPKVRQELTPAPPAPKTRPPRLSKTEQARRWVAQHDTEPTATEVMEATGVSKSVAYQVLSGFRDSGPVLNRPSSQATQSIIPTLSNRIQESTVEATS